jgi:proteasome accessory factor B
MPGFSSRALGISQAERPWKVRLVFSREVATYIGERMWHPGQRMRRRGDGTLELRLETCSRKELTRWILSWVPYVKVVAPRELRERVRERLRQGLIENVK